jgi:hypothetical protein
MGWTRTKYDLNGRVSEIEHFSGSDMPAPWGTNANSTGKKVVQYNGVETRQQDEAGKWVYQESDALGRLVKVTEDPMGGLNYQTAYQYDTQDDLVTVCQGVAACPGGQQRTSPSQQKSLKLAGSDAPRSGSIRCRCCCRRSRGRPHSALGPGPRFGISFFGGELDSVPCP